jgi:hypothetical protein
VLMEDCSLVVSSCDKYETAWYPYFELIKKYWKNHPKKIYLITETKTYTHKGLNIICINAGKERSWSERLYLCLTIIKAKYIIFSLEDFFLLGPVKEKQLEKCYEWMEENPAIAVCRLAVCNDRRLKKTKEYDSFYLADRDMEYRLDTQFALWNRETLISFLDLSENPWQFEGIGSKRIKDTKKIFLWSYAENDYSTETMIIPYRNNPLYGYNIHWGRWLWNNRKWFEQNGIFKVDYHKLGVLSERAAKRRMKYLYNRNPNRFRKVIKGIYQMIDLLERLLQNIRIFGWRAGFQENYGILMKHLRFRKAK